MKTKVLAQKFDKTNKATMRTKSRTTRTGASIARNRTRAHGRVGPK